MIQNLHYVHIFFQFYKYRYQINNVSFRYASPNFKLNIILYSTCLIALLIGARHKNLIFRGYSKWLDSK